MTIQMRLMPRCGNAEAFRISSRSSALSITWQKIRLWWSQAHLCRRTSFLCFPSLLLKIITITIFFSYSMCQPPNKLRTTKQQHNIKSHHLKQWQLSHFCLELLLKHLYHRHSGVEIHLVKQKANLHLQQLSNMVSNGIPNSSEVPIEAYGTRTVEHQLVKLAQELGRLLQDIQI